MKTQNTIPPLLLLLLLPFVAYADEQYVRAYYMPDTTVSIVIPAGGQCVVSEGHTECLDKITENIPERVHPHEDMPISALPTNRADRDKWTGSVGGGVYVDHQRITRGGKVGEFQQKIEEEMDKDRPDADLIIQYQRLAKKYSGLESSLVKQDDVDRIERRNQSRIKGAVSAVSDFIGGVFDGLRQGVLAITSVFTNTLTVGTPEAPTGITVYDKVTGAPNCIIVSGGQLSTNPGECASPSVGVTAGPTPEVPQSPQEGTQTAIEPPADATSPEVVSGELPPIVPPSEAIDTGEVIPALTPIETPLPVEATPPAVVGE